MDKLGVASRLKRNTIYLEVDLPPLHKIEERDGKYFYDFKESPETILLTCKVHEDFDEENEDIECNEMIN